MNEYSRSRMSRSAHHHKSSRAEFTRRKSIRNLRVTPPWHIIVIISAILSVVSVANPLMLSFADSLQTQALYAGRAFLAGHVPYMDFYGASGLLYYGLLMLGSLVNVGFPILLMGIQFSLLVFAGAMFYKISYHLTQMLTLSRQMLWIFYLCIGVLGWGGLYAPLFALPFVLNGLLFLLRYFTEETSDEGFILFGVNGAITFLIDPKSSLLWIVAFFFLLVYNIRVDLKARGFYQFLASILGFSLILYSVGYYTILYQNVGPAIEQTFLTPLMSLGQWQEGLFWSLFLNAAYLLGTGLLTSFVYGAITLTRFDHRDSKLLLYITLVSSIIFICLLPQFSVSQLLCLMPYGLSLTAIYIAERSKESRWSFRDDEDWRDEPEIVKSYWVLNAFLPAIAVVYLVAYPGWIWLSQAELQEDRQTVAKYVAQETDTGEFMYAWDNSAYVYLASDRYASAKIMTPDTYLAREAEQTDLALSLSHDRARFIVVNKEQAMSDSVAKHLEESYEEIPLNLKELRLYQLK